MTRLLLGYVRIRTENRRLRRKLAEEQTKRVRAEAAWRMLDVSEHEARVALELERRTRPGRPYIADDPKEAA